MRRLHNRKGFTEARGCFFSSRRAALSFKWAHSHVKSSRRGCLCTLFFSIFNEITVIKLCNPLKILDTKDDKWKMPFKFLKFNLNFVGQYEQKYFI